MKTAIFISGHARTFGVEAVYRSQKCFVFNKLPDPHFFCSVVDDEQADSLERLVAEYGKKRVFIERIPAQPDCVAMLGLTADEAQKMTIHAPYALAPHASAQTVLRSLWAQRRTWEMHLPHAKADHPFDLYVRHRPDLFWHCLQVPDVAPADVCVPYWGGYGGINDRFAIMGGEAARHYFTAFDRVLDLLKAGWPMHPETLSGAALAQCPVRVRPTLIAEFTGVRLPKDGKCETVPAVITQQDHFRFAAAIAAGL